MLTATLVETPTPNRLPRLSFRWWEHKPSYTCACGRELNVHDHDPNWKQLRDEGWWSTTCPGWTDRHGGYHICGRVLVLYNLSFQDLPLPRGPAPTQAQREAGLTDDDIYDMA